MPTASIACCRPPVSQLLFSAKQQQQPQQQQQQKEKTYSTPAIIKQNSHKIYECRMFLYEIYMKAFDFICFIVAARLSALAKLKKAKAWSSKMRKMLISEEL
uniref:Uncharacterized protein n=1 Tax=Glossina pallidipes TaxID=7398 RepID=A0A1A9ZB85_GLOPL